MSRQPSPASNRSQASIECQRPIEDINDRQSQASVMESQGPTGDMPTMNNKIEVSSQGMPDLAKVTPHSSKSLKDKPHSSKSLEDKQPVEESSLEESGDSDTPMSDLAAVSEFSEFEKKSVRSGRSQKRKGRHGKTRDSSADSSPSLMPQTKRKKRSKRTPSVSSNSNSSGSSGDDSDYVMFSPATKKASSWRLKGKCKAYAKARFTEFLTEQDLQDTIKKVPVPSNSFLEAPGLDETIRDNITENVPKNPAEAFISLDNKLKFIQKKALRIMGPLGKLWHLLDSHRKDGSKVSLNKLLRLAEAAVLFSGQTNVALNHLRRKRALVTLSRDDKKARKVLSRYSKYLADGGQLFGDDFIKMVEKGKDKATKGLSVLCPTVKPKPKPGITTSAKPPTVQKTNYTSSLQNKPFPQRPPKVNLDSAGQFNYQSGRPNKKGKTLRGGKTSK